MKLFLLMTLIMVTGCGQSSSPLGTFAEKDWSRDCETAIVREDFRDPSTPGPILRDGGPAFARATSRYRCSPPGWAVYTEKGGRVVGLCVDDDTRRGIGVSGSFHDTVDHETDRARRIITAHWGSKLAGEMLRGASDDHCSPSSEPAGHDMLRWGAAQLVYPQPETIHSLNMCCWETTN